jgi:outer membrane protein
MLLSSIIRKTALALGVASVLYSPAAMAESPRFEFALGGSVGVAPKYQGADSYGLGVGGSFKFTNLQLGGVTLAESDGWRDSNGFAISPTLRLIGPRRAGDHADLTGTNDISRALELGARAQFTTDDWQVYATLRRGVRGHRGWSGEAGFNGFFAASDALTLSAGPRVEFGNARYQRTYFGVTAAEVGPSGMREYTPGSGIHAAGLALGALYEISPQWAITGELEYMNLTGPARNSPIVARGSRSQIAARVGVVHRVSLF